MALQIINIQTLNKENLECTTPRMYKHLNVQNLECANFICTQPWMYRFKKQALRQTRKLRWFYSSLIELQFNTKVQIVKVQTVYTFSPLSSLKLLKTPQNSLQLIKISLNSWNLLKLVETSQTSSKNLKFNSWNSFW